MLQAQGYSYAEICVLCRWTYTKVNRCLAEGRARLRAGGAVSWIEGARAPKTRPTAAAASASSPTLTAWTLSPGSPTRGSAPRRSAVSSMGSPATASRWSRTSSRGCFAELRMGFRILRNADCVPPEVEARKEAARLGALIATAGSAGERARLCRLRADAELRYRILAERRRLG